MKIYEVLNSTRDIFSTEVVLGVRLVVCDVCGNCLPGKQTKDWRDIGNGDFCTVCWNELEPEFCENEVRINLLASESKKANFFEWLYSENKNESNSVSETVADFRAAELQTLSRFVCSPPDIATPFLDQIKNIYNIKN